MGYLDVVLIVLIVLYSVKVLQNLKKFIKELILADFSLDILKGVKYEYISKVWFDDGYPMGLVNQKCHVNAYNQAVRSTETYKRDCEIIVCLCVGDDDAFVHMINHDFETGKYYDVTLGAYGNERVLYYQVSAIRYPYGCSVMPNPGDVLMQYKEQVLNDNFNWFERLFVGVDDL